MTQEHKEALKQGRLEARVVKAYLRALELKRPGRPVTRGSLQTRLERVIEKIAASDDPLRTLELIQAKLDLEDALKQVEDSRNFEELESAFITHAGPFSERKGISYPAWREMGVPAAVLKAAKIPETRRR